MWGIGVFQGNGSSDTGAAFAGSAAGSMRGLLLAASRLGLATDRLAYVGDALNDLRCARAVDAVAVAAAWGHLYEIDEEPHVLASTPGDLVALLRRSA